MALKSKPLSEVRADVPVHEVNREAMVPISLRVPESLRKQWKVAAALAGETVTDIIIRQMSAWLESQKVKKSKAG